MLKRYIVLKNGVELGEANNDSEIYKVINCTKQHYYHTIKKRIYEDDIIFKGDKYTLIDRVNPKV